MTKGTKTFRIIICVLLAFTMICSALFCLHISEDVMGEEYGIYVDGVSVTKGNEDDVLGNGTVRYDSYNNILMFNNAVIDSENWPVYSKIDLNIQLIGENKFVCKNEAYSAGVYAGDNYLAKDLALIGDGSLTIELPNKSGDAVGIYGADVTIMTDTNITIADCENQIHGIVTNNSLQLVGGATVTVNSGAAKYSAAVRVRGNALFENGTALRVSVNPGTSGGCKGFNVSGDLFLGKGVSLDVSIDDAATDLGECIRVSGLMELGIDSTVKASAKNAYAIECFGAIEANQGAAVSAVSDQKDADVFCSGAVINCGADIDGEIDAIGGVHNRD